MGRMKSQWQIEREAKRLLRRSSRLVLDPDPVTALIKEAGHTRRDKLLPSTIRRLRPSYRVALVMLDPESGTRYDELHKKLEKRRGKPRKKRGASLKVTEVDKEVAKATFTHLKAIVLRTRSPSAFAAALYVLVVSRIAIRPIELLDAEVVGDELRVRNAKWRPGLPVYRRISLKRFSSTFIEAAKWLCVLARDGVGFGPEETKELRFHLWRNRVAESLARASETVTAPNEVRLSLYSFRHLGIASWKAAGFSESEIALLAGHLNLGTAAKHYAPARAGWADETALALPVEPGEADLQPAKNSADTERPTDDAAEASTGQGADALEMPASSGRPVIDLDDFPMPAAARQADDPYRVDFDAYREKLEQQAEEAVRSAERLKSLPAPPERQTDLDKGKKGG